MDLALNDLQMLICRKTQPTKQHTLTTHRQSHMYTHLHEYKHTHTLNIQHTKNTKTTHTYFFIIQRVKARAILCPMLKKKK